MIFENGDQCWMGGLDIQIYNKLNGRQKSLPKPSYVATVMRIAIMLIFLMEIGECSWRL